MGSRLSESRYQPMFRLLGNYANSFVIDLLRNETIICSVKSGSCLVSLIRILTPEKTQTLGLVCMYVGILFLP